MKYLKISLLVLTVCLPFTLVAQAKGPDKPDAVKLYPDIVIHKVSVAKLGENPDGSHRIRITALLLNVSKFSNCTGPFKVKCEWTQDPTVGFTFLRDAGVAKLCFDASSATITPLSLFFDDVVAARSFKKYRITADHLNQVVEMNEGNNVDSVGYNNGAAN